MPGIEGTDSGITSKPRHNNTYKLRFAALTDGVNSLSLRATWCLLRLPLFLLMLQFYTRSVRLRFVLDIEDESVKQ